MYVAQSILSSNVRMQIHFNYESYGFSGSSHLLLAASNGHKEKRENNQVSLTSP